MDPLDTIIHEHYKEKLSNSKGIPFNLSLRASGAVVTEKGRHYLYIKGAPEIFLKHMSAKERYKAEAALDEYTKKGYRTIGCGHILATKTTKEITTSHIKKATFDGFIAFADPMRDGIAGAIKEAHDAGINVVMLTGDHVNTAEQIGKQAGLVTASNQVASSELLQKPRPQKAMETILAKVKVFGRVLPKHKFNFLKSVKKSEITAMTGDGVNDIPALVEADAGLAMGSGTDAAKDASDIVLLDDNFVTIIDAIRLGRAVIANIRKMLFYLISTSIGEAAAMIGALLLGLPLPVTAVQILWMNIVTDGFTVLPLGLSDPEKHQMKQPPHRPDAPLLSKVLATRTIIAGLTMAIVGLFFFNKLLPQGYAYAQTATFLSLVVGQWANALNANYERASWFKNIIHPNWKLFAGILLSIAFQVFAMYGPLKDAFGVVPLSTGDIITITVVSTIATLVVVDIHKLSIRLLSR
jgi:Ca2+-transporting ATPase